MTRALLLTSHPVDGRDGADKEIAVALAEGVPEVDFTYFARAGARPPARGRRLPVLSRQGLPGVLERGQVALRSPLLARKVDLVHAVMTIGPQFARWSRSPLRPHGMPVVHTVPGVSSPAALHGVRPFATTVALAEFTATRLREAGFPDVRVVPPGIDLERWAPSPRPVATARPVLLFAGHFGPGGGVEEALLTAAEVERAGRPVRLVLALRHRAGHHVRREAEAVTERAVDLGLTDVAVHQRVSDMTRLVAEADVVLFLPRRLAEGKADVPLTVVEALAAGRPVVLSDLPQVAAVADVVPVVRPGDAAGAARAVERLLASDREYDAAVLTGRTRVVENFSAEVMCRRYRDIYAELLDGRPAPAAR